jgi:hypothetical protein
VAAVVVAAVADVCVLLAARSAEISLDVPMPLVAPGAQMPWYVPATVAAGAALAGAVLAGLLRRTRAGASAFGWTVAVVAPLSCVPLLALGLPAASTAVLASMHLIPGAVVLVLLLPVLRRRPVTT